jgi:hypothetical protein
MARFEALESRNLLAVLNVNTNLDLMIAGDGLVSLREAIAAANNDTATDLGETGSGVDTIRFVGVTGTIELTLGEFSIDTEMTIEGPGSELLTIDAAQSSRIFDINAPPIPFSGEYLGEVTLQGLTLTGGKTTGDGGAIRLEGTQLHLLDCAIIDNEADGHGGGIYAEGHYNYGYPCGLNLTDSIVTGNTAGGSGGGIYAYFTNMVVGESVISENHAMGTGGGVWTNEFRSLQFHLYDSELTNNTANGSGGGFAGGNITIEDSLVSGNSTSKDSSVGLHGGGGLLILGDAVIRRTLITGNSAPNGWGGGMLIDGIYAGASIGDSTISNNSAGLYGGGILSTNNPLEVFNSLIRENHAGESGGGISSTLLTLRECTITGNTAGQSGGGLSVFRLRAVRNAIYGNTADESGGGVQAWHVEEFVNNTVSGNRAEGNGGGMSFSVLGNFRYNTVTANESIGGIGGGMWRFGEIAGTSLLAGSIIAGNTAAGGTPDLSVPVALIDLQNSLIGDNSGSMFAEAQTPDANGNLIGSAGGGGVIDPRLGPLADNGGPTKTHALLASSPAIDAIPLDVVEALVPTHDYQFNNSLADAQGGPALVALGGTLTASRYDFALNQGLNLSSPAIDPGEYTIEIFFRWNNLSGTFQKIIDFTNLTENEGLYTFGNRLRFFDQASVANQFTANVDYRLTLTRDEVTDVVRAYINGVEIWNFVDTAGDAVFSGPNSVIRFFQDDTVTGQLDAQSGSVDRIRIFDEALTAEQILNLDVPPPPSPVPTTDQRGFDRIIDGDGIGGEQIDMGAYERQTPYVPIGGDYNADGFVDAVDYTVWRNRSGQSLTLPGENPTAATPGLVDQEDYDFWKSNYGNQDTGDSIGAGGLAAASGSTATVEVRASSESNAVAAEPLHVVEAAAAGPSVPFEFTVASAPRSSRVASLDAERNTERATSREEALLAWLASRPASSRTESWGAGETPMEDGERDRESDADAIVFDQALCLLGE